MLYFRLIDLIPLIYMYIMSKSNQDRIESFQLPFWVVNTDSFFLITYLLIFGCVKVQEIAQSKLE